MSRPGNQQTVVIRQIVTVLDHQFINADRQRDQTEMQRQMPVDVDRDAALGDGFVVEPPQPADTNQTTAPMENPATQRFVSALASGA